MNINIDRIKCQVSAAVDRRIAEYRTLLGLAEVAGLEIRDRAVRR